MSDSSTKTKTEVIELLLPEHLLLTYALLAHEQDITLNQWFVNAALAHVPEVDYNGEANTNK